MKHSRNCEKQAKTKKDVKLTLIDFYGKLFFNEKLDNRRKIKEGKNLIAVLENLK